MQCQFAASLQMSSLEDREEVLMQVNEHRNELERNRQSLRETILFIVKQLGKFSIYY